MSRTDVHRPWSVQRDDLHNRHRLHRHQTWANRPPELVPLYSVCGCPMCTGRHERRAERRRDRHGWRRDLRRGLLD